jgi:two-component system nitrate/nitrite response regulator NarL
MQEAMMVDSPKKISILLASDFSILSESLISIFKNARDLKLVGSANSVEELNLQMNKLRPQVLLIDASIKCEKFSSLLTQLSDRDTKILVMNQDLSPAQTIEALRCGAHGVIGRKTPPDLLCRCVRAVAAGDIWVGRGVTKELVQFLRSRKAEHEAGHSGNGDAETLSVDSAGVAGKRFGLTKRELQVIQALVEAQTNKDIAETFGISEYTVKHHLTNIFDKLGVYNRVELALFAIHHRLCSSVVGPAFSAPSIRPPALMADRKSR